MGFAKPAKKITHATDNYTDVAMNSNTHIQTQSRHRQVRRGGRWLTLPSSVKKPVHRCSGTQRGSSIGYHYSVCQWRSCKTPTPTQTTQGRAKKSWSWETQWQKGQLYNRHQTEFIVQNIRSHMEQQAWNCQWLIKCERKNSLKPTLRRIMIIVLLGLQMHFVRVTILLMHITLMSSNQSSVL